MKKIILGILVAVFIFGVVGASFADTGHIGDKKRPTPTTAPQPSSEPEGH